MKAGTHLIQPDVKVNTICGGILDDITKRTGRNQKWELT